MLYRGLVRPCLFWLPAERAHRLAMAALRFVQRFAWGRAWLRALGGRPDARLAVRLWGRTMAHPVGLAAGFDKDAEAVSALAALGFAHVEVGTVTPRPQAGNPMPRLFRLPQDGALINRMGFNNHGMQATAARLRRPHPCVLGINLGKNRDVAAADAAADYAALTRTLAPLADYLVLNVSSPNTPGLRDLQQVEALRLLIQAVREAGQQAMAPAAMPPLLVKVAPDLDDAALGQLAQLCQAEGVDGLIATNTTIHREDLKTPQARLAAIGAGGLSGAPLKDRALAVLRLLREATGGQLPLIAVGGIANAEDVWARLVAGASLVQVYTAFVYEGPGLLRRLQRDLAAKVAESGHATLTEAVAAARRRNLPFR